MAASLGPAALTPRYRWPTLDGPAASSTDAEPTPDLAALRGSGLTKRRPAPTVYPGASGGWSLAWAEASRAPGTLKGEHDT